AFYFPLYSYDVRKILLHSAEVEGAADQDEHGGKGGDKHHRAGARVRSQQRPAETFDDADERVQAVQGLPHRVFVQEAAGVGDGGGEHPELGQEGDDVPDVAVLDVKG